MTTRQFDIITIFPGMFESPFNESILKRAQNEGLLKITLHDLRDYTRDKNRKVDDLRTDTTIAIRVIKARTREPG